MQSKKFQKSRIVPKKSEGGGGLGEIVSVLSRFCLFSFLFRFGRAS